MELNELELDLASERRLYEAGIRPSTAIGLLLLSRLEQAEARVKLLESGIVADLVITSVHSARAIGATVSGISEALLKLGYDGLTERLEQAEQDRDKLRNRLDAMRRQRDGYRNQLRKTEQQVQRVRELADPDWCLSIPAGAKRELLRALDGDTRRFADQGLGDKLARTTKNGDNNE
ncbi:hypothetical protein [Glutamicibacter nicotianae]|uniref:hypothetical protein n=1 Tax=Glutamicibacter nicotianae TaxID=37929 RepID=UPI00167F4BF9|nr:hypothetical protein [Glutamicibacter nicotianae]